jgi:hypothetical protein
MIHKFSDFCNNTNNKLSKDNIRNESVLVGIMLSLMGVLTLAKLIVKMFKGKVPNKWLELLTAKDLKISVTEFSDRFFIRAFLPQDKQNEYEIDFRILKNSKTLITPTNLEVKMSDDQYNYFMDIISKYSK